MSKMMTIGNLLGDLLNFSYHQNYNKLIGISSQKNTNITQKINFTGK